MAYYTSEEYPRIPEHISADDIAFVVSIYHEGAFEANSTTTHQKIAVNNEHGIGCRVFVGNQPTLTFGRLTRSSRVDPKARTQPTLDIYLPHSSIAQKQFRFVPVPETGMWRAEATSEVVTVVNGAQLQKYTSRTKKNKINYPQAVYLDRTRINVVEACGMRIEAWFLHDASQVAQLYPTFQPDPLIPQVQEIEDRLEQWAQHRYIMPNQPDQVSSNSFVVIQRFTGAREVAKLFPERNGLKHRALELRIFCKDKVNESIVRYKAATEINHVPAAITDTHYGMVPYGIAQQAVKKQHPGIRFSIAAGMVRPIFLALEYLHYNHVVHGLFTPWDSVLLRIIDNRLDRLILVDYSSVCSFAPGEAMPQSAMHQDARRAMELIDDCCELWNLRSQYAPTHIDEKELREVTERAQEEYDVVNRVCHTHFHTVPDPESSEAKTVLQVLDEKGMAWNRAWSEQVDNAEQKEISLLTREQLDQFKGVWQQARQRREPEPPMILSLGHAFLDDLVTALYRRKWVSTPHEICEALRRCEGEERQPWRRIRIRQLHRFTVEPSTMLADSHLVRRTRIDGNSLMLYLAVCCDMYPLLRDSIVKTWNEVVVPDGNEIFLDTVKSFLEVLSNPESLPNSIHRTIHALHTLDVGSQHVHVAEEIHDVCYHVPSQMFNVTQMLRFASNDRLASCFRDNKVWCNNFVEVRGEPSIEGCYVPLRLLPEFLRILELTALEEPVTRPIWIMQEDPADFSTTVPDRIVLAHRGLVGYATMTRKYNQFSHALNDVNDYLTADPFLPTYFGDLKVLPARKDGMMNHPRPSHWAGYLTSEAAEAASRLPKCVFPEPGKRRATKTRHNVSWLSDRVLLRDDADEVPDLEKVIRERASLFKSAKQPIKRPSSPGSVQSERRQQARVRKPEDFEENIGLTSSFGKRNPNAHRIPPQRGANPSKDFIGPGHIPTDGELQYVHHLLSNVYSDADLPVTKAWTLDGSKIRELDGQSKRPTTPSDTEVDTLPGVAESTRAYDGHYNPGDEPEDSEPAGSTEQQAGGSDDVLFDGRFFPHNVTSCVRTTPPARPPVLFGVPSPMGPTGVIYRAEDSRTPSLPMAAEQEAEDVEMQDVQELAPD